MRLLPIVIAVSLLVAACGRGLDEAAAGTTTSSSTTTTSTTLPPEEFEGPETTAALVIWADPAIAGPVDTAAGEFTTASGIEVTVEAIPLAEMEERVRTQLGPDIFVGTHTSLARLAPRGLAAPISFEARAEEFAPVAVAAFTYRDDVRGVPYAMETIALFHNPALTPEPPGAFSQIKNTCDELRGVTAEEEDAAQAQEEQAPPPQGPEHCVQIAAADSTVTLPFLTAFGGYLYGETDGFVDTADVGIDSSGAQAGAEFLRNLVVDGFVTGAADRVEMVTSFAAGETVYLIGGRALADELTAAGAPFEAAPLPIMAGNTPVPYVDVRGFMVAGRSRQQETAALFLNDYLASGPTMEAIFATTGGLPAQLATAAIAEPDPVLGAFLAAAAGGVPTPVTPFVEEAMAALGPALAALFDPEQDLDTVLAGAAEAVRGAGSAGG